MQQIAWLPERAQVPVGQHSVLLGQMSPAQGTGVVVVDVVDVVVGDGVGMVGLVRASRASAPSTATSPAIAAPPNPKNPFRIVRREAPRPTTSCSPAHPGWARRRSR